MTLRSKLLRYSCMTLYLLVARHLPWSPRPGGKLSRRIRGLLAQRMLDRCGTNVNVEHGAWFGSGAGIELGDNADLGMDSLIMGPVTIGADVMMGPRCLLVSRTHTMRSVEKPMNVQGFDEDRRITVGEDVWIGANVTIVPGVTIGRGSVVAAGSVVARDVPPFTVVAGNPAVVKRHRGAPPEVATPQDSP